MEYESAYMVQYNDHNHIIFLSSDFFLFQKLSILPRSRGALGFTYTPPNNEDRYLVFIDELRGRIVTLLGGRAAEEVIYCGRVSTGAFDDIRRATDMAYKAVAEYGLNETIGPISLTTLSGGGFDESGGSSPWRRDNVIHFLISLLQLGLYFYFTIPNYTMASVLIISLT